MGLTKRIYKNAPYHGLTDNAVKSRAPIDGQAALDNSVQVKLTLHRRVGLIVLMEKSLFLTALEKFLMELRNSTDMFENGMIYIQTNRKL